MQVYSEKYLINIWFLEYLNMMRKGIYKQWKKLIKF